MSEFQSRSPFYHRPLELEATNAKETTRRVGQPNVVEIPERVLDDWIDRLDVLASTKIASVDADSFLSNALQDLRDEVYSYLRG